VETGALYRECRELYDIYHLNVQHGNRADARVEPSFRRYLDRGHYRNVSLANIADVIVAIVAGAGKEENGALVQTAPDIAAREPAGAEAAAANEKRTGFMAGLFKGISW
jgi:hypothetical protein